MISKLSFYQEPEITGTPYRRLALEKYLTFHVQEGECILYLWQNIRTVVIGKNQNAWKECRVSKLTADGGFLVRRLSGGGAVYHDRGNLNFTFCVRKKDYDISRQTRVILAAVQSLGIPAEMTGRNDLTAEGRKFSGNAYYESGAYCYHHGTLMLDVDREALSAYLNVPKEKLQSKGVDSVRSRVVNLKELCPGLTREILSEALKEAFSKEYGLPVSVYDPRRLDPEELRKDTLFFSSEEWIFGRKLPFTHRIQARFDWGGIELLLEVNEGKIVDCICHSDAMNQETAARIPEMLKGHRYEKKELTALFSGNSGEKNTNEDSYDPFEDRCQTDRMKRDIRSLLEKEL